LQTASQKAWYARNRERVLAKMKSRYQTDATYARKRNEYQAAWEKRKRAANPGHAKQEKKRNALRMRLARVANRDLFNERNRAWKRANRDKVYAAINARRAWKRGQRCTCCTYTTIQRIYLAARVLRAEVDHKKPLSIGGKHCRKNLQILSPAAHRLKTARDNKRIQAFKEKQK